MSLKYKKSFDKYKVKSTLTSGPPFGVQLASSVKKTEKIAQTETADSSVDL